MKSTLSNRYQSVASAAWALSLGILMLGSPAGAETQGSADPPVPPAPPVAPAPLATARGWLGVQIQPLDEGLREAFDFRKPGVLVGEVSPGSPAARAGILRGDILVSVDGNQVASPEELTDAVREHGPGDSVAIGRVRDGKEQRVNVLLEGTPSPRAPRAPRAPSNYLDGAYLGARIETLGPDLAKYFDVDPDAGVLVVEVAPDSPASKVELKPGDVITTLNSDSVANPRALLAALDERKAGDQVTIGILRHGKSMSLQATLAPAPIGDRMKRVMRLAPRDMDPMINDLRQRLEILERKLNELTSGKK
jgi:S1-C subfamily serine protease